MSPKLGVISQVRVVITGPVRLGWPAGRARQPAICTEHTDCEGSELEARRTVMVLSSGLSVTVPVCGSEAQSPPGGPGSGCQCSAGPLSR